MAIWWWWWVVMGRAQGGWPCARKGQDFLGKEEKMILNNMLWKREFGGMRLCSSFNPKCAGGIKEKMTCAGKWRHWQVNWCRVIKRLKIAENPLSAIPHSCEELSYVLVLIIRHEKNVLVFQLIPCIAPFELRIFCPGKDKAVEDYIRIVQSLLNILNALVE